LKKACLIDCGGLVASANRLHSSISLLLLKQKMMEVLMTTGLLEISRAKLQSNHHHQQTNIQFFYRPDALPVAQPTVSKH